MPKFLVETVELVKRQYVVDAEDQVAANDIVTMLEVRYFDKCSLGETIVSSSVITGIFDVPNVDPIKAAKIQSIFVAAEDD